MNAPPQRPDARLASDEAGLRGALANLRSILIPEETLEAWAVQRRFFALNRRRMLIAATSGRLVWITRKLLGGFDVSNVRWQDLEDVTLHVGMVGAELVVRAARPADLASASSFAGAQVYTFKGLRAEQAQAVYRICQAQDQAWREKRRIRELEELRARSGGVQLGAAAAGRYAAGPAGWAATPSGPVADDSAEGASSSAGGNPAVGASRSAQPGKAGSSPDVAGRLLEAKKLYQERLITDSEYEAIKARILSGS